MLVYLVTNNVNSKVYVGKLAHKKSLENYWLENISKANKNHKAKPYLYAAIRKHRAESFSVQQIETCNTAEELCLAEIKWIKQYDSNNPDKGYNLTTGGEGNSGHLVSPEARAKISAARKGKPLSEEHKQKLREAKLNKPTNYWLGKKRPNAFGGKEKMFSTKGMKVLYLYGKKKYVSEEEYNLQSCKLLKT